MASSTLGAWPAGTHQHTRNSSTFWNHSRRRRRYGVWAVRYTKSWSCSGVSHTDRLMITSGSSSART